MVVYLRINFYPDLGCKSISYEGDEFENENMISFKYLVNCRNKNSMLFDFHIIFVFLFFIRIYLIFL